MRTEGFNGVGLLSTTFAFLAGLTPIVLGAECTAITTEANRALTTYVSKRYEVASLLKIEMEETGLERGCFRQVRFFSITPGRPFEVILFVSPDQSFLVPDVFGVHEDPLKERKLVSSLLQRRLIPQEGPNIGRPNAPVSLVMFTDFQCRFCRAAAEIIKTEILPGNEDKILFAIRQHPLPSHDWARKAAEIGVCANRQGQQFFWTFHDYIFKSQLEISANNVKAKSTAFLGTLSHFNVSAFEECMSSSWPKEALLRDENIGQGLEVSATPTFFINGAKEIGIGDTREFKTLIERYIHSTN